MKKSMKKLLTLILLLCVQMVIAQPTTDPNFSPVLATALQNALQQRGDALGIRNLSACVFVPGQGTWVGVYNAAGVPVVSTDARFGIASNSKSFVAGLCLRLKKEGLLNLDVPISTYLPNIAQISRHVQGNITTRQLLNHQAGLFDFYNQSTDSVFNAFNANPNRIWQPAEILATIGIPNHAPGTSYYYSNTHFLVAAMVCEAITGKTFSQLLQEKIAQPLGLSRTNYPAGGDAVFNSPYAPLYNSAGTAISLDTARANSFWSTIQAAGGIASTPWDMVRWYRNGLFEKIDSPNTTGTWLNYHIQRELYEVEPWSSYSLGLRARNGESGGSFLYHAGAWGYRSYMISDQRTGIIVCVLGNQYGKSTNIPADTLYATVLAQLPKKALDLDILDISQPKGQTCVPNKLKLRIRNTGTQAIDSATLNTHVEPTCCTSTQTVRFSPALQPNEIRNWESPNNYTDTTRGIAQLNVELRASNDVYPFRATEKSFFSRNPNPLRETRFIENFSLQARGNLPTNWVSYQPNDVQDWRVSPFAGNGGALCKNNFNDGDIGKAYYLELPPMLMGRSNYGVLFKYAYAPYPNADADSLFLEFSSNCGETWQQIWGRGGTDLQTAPATNSSFLPTNSQWSIAQTGLNPNTPNITVCIFRFKAVNAFGNNIWLDSLRVDNIGSTTEIVEYPEARFAPNPMQSQSVLRLEKPVGMATLTVFDVLGRKVLEKKDCSGDLIQLERGNLTSGVYLFTLREKDRLVARGKLSVE